MNDAPTTRSRPNFSPGIAIVVSLPVFILAGALFGPTLWDAVAGFVHWKGPNAARVVRQETSGLLVSVDEVSLAACSYAERKTGAFQFCDSRAQFHCAQSRRTTPSG
jgi:hypothetical protein